jgi:glycine oxidase
MTANSDTLVIGGGIIGLMTARALARRGRSVTVVDRGRVGAEASMAAGGILCPLYPWRLPEPMQALTAAAMQGYDGFIRELEAESGFTVGVRRTGLVVLDEAELDPAEAWASRWDINHRRLDGAGIDALVPGLRGPEIGLHLPGMSNVYSADLIHALKASAAELGIRILENRGVQDLNVDTDGGARVETEGGALSAEDVVIAGGAWSGLLTERLGARLPIRPVRGQIIEYPPGRAELSVMLLHHRRYLVPRPGGELLVGSTLEEAGFDHGTTDDARDVLREAAEGLLPTLKGEMPRRHWAGLRPAAPDQMPYIGAWPGRAASGARLYLNTGHFQNGVLLAPLSGEILAAVMNGEQALFDPSPFRVDREMKSA